MQCMKFGGSKTKLVEPFILFFFDPLSQGAEEHYSAEAIVVLVTLIAISATLAAYCCKVIQCCSPVSHMVRLPTC